MESISYADVYDYERLRSSYEILTCKEEDAEGELFLMDLHNKLVWRLYRPRADPFADAVVLRTILRLAEGSAAMDPTVARLYAQLAEHE